jgi:HSP20 family protein
VADTADQPKGDLTMNQSWRWSGSGAAFHDLQDALSSLFDDWLGPVPAGEARFPQTELLRTEDGYELLVALPGTARDAVELSSERGVLMLEGERRLEPVPEGGTVTRRERPSGRFRRTVQLPAGVDHGRISARLDQGVLRVALPLAEPEQRGPRGIEIEVEEEES